MLILREPPEVKMKMEQNLQRNRDWCAVSYDNDNSNNGRIWEQQIASGRGLKYSWNNLQDLERISIDKSQACPTPGSRKYLI